MPLTAERSGGLVDATDCTGDLWASLHRARPRPQLVCRACRQPMHAKVSPRGLRYFAHDRRQQDCELHGETLLHQQLKACVAALVRERGWAAAVEAVPRHGDTGGWRADVLACEQSGARRVAFEVQLAPMTSEQGQARSERYAADGIETVWLTTRAAPWLWDLPGCQVAASAPSTSKFTVARGIAKLEGDRWRLPLGVPLENVVRGVLCGTAVPCRIGWFSEQTPWGNSTRWVTREDPVAIVPATHAAAHARRERQRTTERVREHAEQAARARNVAALYARQEHLVLPALAAAAEIGRPWIGVPPTLVTEGRVADFVDALGNEKTANGAVIWTGEDRRDLRLFAVLSPVAGRITPGLAASWNRRNVRVYVAEQTERERVARALGRPPEALHLMPADRPLVDVSDAARKRIEARRRAQAERELARAFVG